MIAIDWQNVIAYLLIAIGMTGSAGAAAVFGWRKFRSWKPVVIATSGEPAAAVRSADEPPPVGSVEWADDICSAMGSAPDSSKLAAILAGSTRDQARGLRITELEATP